LAVNQKFAIVHGKTKAVDVNPSLSGRLFVSSLRMTHLAVLSPSSSPPTHPFLPACCALARPPVAATHGMLASMIRGTEHKRLDIQRIAVIKKMVGVPLTLHGGSGTDNDDFRKAIEAGISMIHINTELRVAWRNGLEQALGKNAQSVAPYKLFPEVVQAVKAVVLNRLRLFSGKS
jgi:Fructose-bisphosphate aldolase class-II